MSDDHLNDELKKRIGAVFNDYHDDTAEEGWLLLREKYPEKDEDRPIAWLWRVAGIAALLLAFLSIGLWLNFHDTGKQNIAVKTKNAKGNSSAIANIAIAKNSHPVTDLSLNTARQNQNNTVNPSPISPTATALLSSNIKHPHKNSGSNINQSTATADSSSIKSLAYQLATRAQSLAITQKPLAGNNKATNTATANNNTPLNNPTANNATNTVGNNSNTTASAVTATVQPAEKNNAVTANKPDKSIQSLFDNEKYVSTQNNNVPKIKQKEVSFAVYAATYVNYAKGSSKELNAGGGLTVDFRITDNLSLSTGIAIAQNTLAYNSTSTPIASFPAAVTYDLAASTNFSQLNPASQAFNANLVNLDVPVGLKYVFNPQTKNVYISAGLSSGTFIDETYKYTYNYSIPNNTNGTQSQQESTNKTFDNFYFAKMFNVSFGIGYPLGKNQLIIEPFFKYPINGLGDQHILFGSGGLNLKINFDPPKKSN